MRSFRVDFLREGPWRLPGIKVLAEHYERPLERWLHWRSVVWVQKHYEREILRRAAGKKLILFDEAGALWSTHDWVQAFQQSLLKDKGWVVALGPPHGWTASFKKEGFLVSLGPATLPHDLAGVLVLEQLYRVCSILKGHPYHKI